MDVLVTYDVGLKDPDDQRRLREVAKACEAFGVRVQQSVFECRVSQASLAQLIVDLETIIDPERDSIRIYRLMSTFRDVRQTLGLCRGHEFGSPWLL